MPETQRTEVDEGSVDDGGTSPLSEATPKKKSRTLSQLSNEEQELVALFLERNDYLFNKKRGDHMKADKKNRAWEDLAKEMEKDAKSLTTFFDSIRTQIGKMRRTKSGQGARDMTERQEWIWKRFQFLVPHIGQVKKRTVQSFGPLTQSDPNLQHQTSQVIFVRFKREYLFVCVKCCYI
jgi:hypothetical protein